MNHLVIATVLWIYLISMNSSYYILSNNINIRMISLSSNCNEGRVEFYNGSMWGTLSDCTQSFNSEHGRSICHSLGFDQYNEYWRGMHNYHENISFNPITAYTKINNCSLIFDDNICSQCLFINNINSCKDETDMHAHTQYDIFVSCNEFGHHTQSNAYNCMDIDANDNDMQYASYKSCVSMHDLNHKTHNKQVLLTIIGVAIFGSIFCVIVFAVYSKYQDTKRLSNSMNTRAATRKKSLSNSGFETVPSGPVPIAMVQLGDIIGKKDNYNQNYVPPPQPMFMYQTRQVNEQSEADTNYLKDINDVDDEVDHSNEHVTGGYNMEEIIPNVILNKNKSRSESYGLIKNHDYDIDDDDDVVDQYEQSK